MTEQGIQNSIRLYLTQNGFTSFRVNVGKFKLSDGRWFDTGVPKGFSDIFAVKDGRAYFFEVKTSSGKASKEQLKFIENMKKQGCIAEIVRSVDDVERILKK